MAEATRGSWGGLIGILADIRNGTQPPELDCPHDGTPYQANSNGELVCPFDGYSPEGRTAPRLPDPPSPIQQPSAESTSALLDALQGWS